MRNIFVYKPSMKNIKYHKTPTILLVIGTVIEFIYSKQLPLISIIKGTSEYGDFTGIPLLHGIIINFTIFYSAYLFYVYIETRNKEVGYGVVVQFIIFLLMFQKGAMIICLFIFGNLLFAKIRYQGKTAIGPVILGMVLVGIVVLFLNGVLANIRSGVAWSDNSYIFRVALIKKWPAFVPGQFAWAYSYITTPLGNLNNLIRMSLDNINVSQVIGTVIPIMILKVVAPNSVISLDNSTLMVESMNASSGFYNPAYVGGIRGIVFFYVITMIIIMVFGLWLYKKNEASPMYGIFSMMIVFCFFYDTFNTSVTSLLPLIVWLYFVFKRAKSVFIIRS